MAIVKTSSGYTKPKQLVSNSEKTEDWYRQTGQYYRDACVPAIDKKEALKLYRLANGELDESDYLYVTNPLNTTRYELTGYPARLMNYDIISPNVQLLMGEKARRMFPPIVVAKNSNYHLELLKAEQAKLQVELQKRWVNEVKALGIPLDEEQITIKLEEIANKIKNLPDTLAAEGQDVLEYIMDLNDLPRNFRKGFYDWICTSMVYSYKDVFHNKTYYEMISALNLSYLRAPGIDFVENGDAVKASYIFSINELYDRFQTDPNFDKELKDFIEQNSAKGISRTIDRYYQGMSDIFNPIGTLWKNLFGYLPEEEYSDGIDVDHIQWRGFAKQGRLTRQDIFGNTIVDYVDEDFIPVEGDDIEWRWVDQIYEGYCIGDRYWVGCRPVPIQRGSYDDPHSAKLLYNGRAFFTRHTTPRSLVKKGEAYQKGVNIIKYRAEETLAKNLDKIILFPLGLIPKKEGWDEAKLMYYVRAFGFLFFDDTRPNAASIISALKDLDLSSAQHLMNSFQMVQMIKQEWDQVCGFSPQRKADIGTSAGKGTTQAALETSYVMSEELFLEFEEFERTEYTGMLELSKFAFIDGIQAYYIKQDGTKGFLNLHDPSSFVNSDLAVFVRNGSKELQNLELLRNQVTAFAQNQVDPKMISSIIQGGNFAQLHKIMDEIDMKLEARRQQELQATQDIQASKERIADKQLEFQYYDKELRSYTDIQVALIKEGMQMADDMRKMSENGTATTDTEAFGNLRLGLETNMLKLMDNSIKLKKIISDEKMNKEDNATMLKNKTSGEK